MTEEKKTDGVDESGMAVAGEGVAVPNFDGGDGAIAHSDIRQQALDLKERALDGYWDLSVVLHEIYEKALYRSWGFESWKDYVDEELEVGLRTAQLYVQIQTWFGTLPPAVQGWLRSLGWSKCRRLRGIVTKENSGEWREKVEGKTVREIEAMIKSDVDGDSGSSSGGSGDGGSDDEKPVRFSAPVFRPQLEVVKNAINHAKEVAETDKDGHALTMICQEYLATNTDSVDISSFYRHMEDTTGHRIIAMSKGPDGKADVVYGSEHIEDDSPGADDSNS